jgi:hypothetical protein
MVYTVDLLGDANLRVRDLTITRNTYLANVVVDASADLNSVTTVGNTTTNSIEITSAQASTSKLTGALKVSGGMGVQGNVHVGSNLFVESNLEVGTANLFVDTQNGNVGIGTTDPSATLHVNGDVAISSNLAVSGSKFTYDNTNTTIFTGTNASVVASEIGYLDMSTSSSSNNIRVKIFIQYTQSGAQGEAEYSYYIRPNSANTSSIYDYINKGGPITPVVYRTDATELWTGGTPGVVRFGYSIITAQFVNWRVEVTQRSNNVTFYPTNTGLAVDGTGLVQVTPAPSTNFNSNLAVNTNTLFVDTTTGNVGIGTTDPDTSFHVYGNIVGHPVIKTRTITKGPSLVDETETFTLNPDENRIVLNNNQGSVGSTRRYRANFTSGVPTTVGTVLHLEINSQRVNTDATGRGHQSVIQFNGTSILDTGYIILSATGGNDSYDRKLQRTIILTDDGWKDYSMYPKISAPTTDDAIIFSTTEHATSTDLGNTELTERMRITDTGNVGIGVTDPVSKLELGASFNSDGNTTNMISFRNSKSGYYEWQIGPTLYSGSAAFSIRGGDHGYDNLTNIFNVVNQNVGIGDTSPSYKLDVNGTLRCFGFTNSSSDDRIKYNEQNVSNTLTLISQLKPQKYEKIMERPNPSEGTWIPTDDEWENVKENYKYGDEFGFIAQDVREVPELAFLVNGEETRTDTKTSTLEEYSNLTTEEQSTYTISYLHESNVITQEEYSNLTPEEQEASVAQYTKEIETQTPLSLNYNGLFVLAIGAIQELKAKNDALEARILALEGAS